jgi:hypothetical protein
MSIGFLLNKKDDAVIWRGPRKNGLIKQFLTDVGWGKLDFLIIDRGGFKRGFGEMDKRVRNLGFNLYVYIYEKCIY